MARVKAWPSIPFSLNRPTHTERESLWKRVFRRYLLLGSWQKKDNKDEVIYILRVYILHMYVYYKADKVYG